MAVNIKKKAKSTEKTETKGILPADKEGNINVGEGTLLIDGNPIGDVEELQIELNKPSAHLSVEYPDGTVKNIDFEVKQASGYIGPTVNVGLSLAFTKNTGNYENVKAQVSIHIPCSHEEIEDTYSFVKEWAEEKINEIAEAENEE